MFPADRVVAERCLDGAASTVEVSAPSADWFEAGETMAERSVARGETD